MGFWLEYLHLILVHSKGHGQGQDFDTSSWEMVNDITNITTAIK